MREKDRIPRILALIQELWEIYPDMRFGQLMENYIIPCERNGMSDACIFYTDDDDFEDALREFINKRKNEE